MKCGYCGKEITPTKKQKDIAERGRAIYHPECYRLAILNGSKKRRASLRIERRKQKMQQLVLEELGKLPEEIVEVVKNDALKMAEVVAAKTRRTHTRNYTIPIIKMACEKNGIGYRLNLEPKTFKYLSFVREITGVGYVPTSRMLSNLIKLIAKREGVTGDRYRELHSTARELLKLSEKEKGETPLAIVAGIAYLACILTDVGITQGDMRELTGLSEFCIRYTYKKLIKKYKI